MNEIKASYKALEPVQRAVFEQKHLAVSDTVQRCVELLGPVAAFERQCDALIEQHGPFFQRRFARRHRLKDGFSQKALLEITDMLLPVLAADHDPGAPLELTVQFPGPAKDSSKTGESEPYKRGAYYKIVDSFYSDRWLEGHARFVDGADVRFSCTLNARVSKKRKRNPRGKIKVKEKYKAKSDVEVVVSFPARNYKSSGGEGTRRTAGRKEMVKASENRTVVRLSRTYPYLDASAIGMVIDLIGEAYAQVAPARRKRL